MSEVIDHVGIRVSDLPASRRLYEASLGELGFAVLSEGEFAGAGRNRVTTGAHIAFPAEDADSVRRWHDAALRHGAEDNGPPGERPEYTGRYYAAFVLDPDS